MLCKILGSVLSHMDTVVSWKLIKESCSVAIPFIYGLFELQMNIINPTNSLQQISRLAAAIRSY